MTPKAAVRAKCIECTGGLYQPDRCKGDKMIGQGINGQCFFYPYRNGKGRPSVKTIRLFCVECMGGSYQLVKECPSTDCPIYHFRLGTNPNRAGIGLRSGPAFGVEPGFSDCKSMFSCQGI
jgi:hypothetical protein